MSLGGCATRPRFRGHRRTYIGAMPGRIIQAIKRTGTRNPVFMLDEVDKIGMDWRGDPQLALLEVLDPQQNSTFRDHYLDVDFDLSDVIFITTANTLDTIPAPCATAWRSSFWKATRSTRSCASPKVIWSPASAGPMACAGGDRFRARMPCTVIIRDYTREAGVRNLEREIGQVVVRLR